jgi:hypothetical protein
MSPPAAYCVILASPKSRILACPALRYEDVPWFYVAVDNALELIRNVGAERQQSVVL